MADRLFCSHARPKIEFVDELETTNTTYCFPIHHSIQKWSPQVEMNQKILAQGRINPALPFEDYWVALLS